MVELQYVLKIEPMEFTDKLPGEKKESRIIPLFCSEKLWTMSLWGRSHCGGTGLGKNPQYWSTNCRCHMDDIQLEMFSSYLVYKLGA